MGQEAKLAIGLAEKGIQEIYSFTQILQALVVDQTLDRAIHRINHYPVDKYLRKQLRYPLDTCTFLSGG